MKLDKYMFNILTFIYTKCVIEKLLSVKRNIVFQDEIKKILMFVKYFQPFDRKKLSVMLYIWIANGSVPFNAILVLNNSHLVKDHLALDFLIDMFKAWRQEKGVNSLHSAIKKSNIESHLISFIPDTKQSQQYFRNAFQVTADIITDKTWSNVRRKFFFLGQRSRGNTQTIQRSAPTASQEGAASAVG